VEDHLKPSLIAAAGVAAALLTGQGAFAAGHLAGAAVGAVVAPKHHRVAGAVVGGAVGHHMAKEKAKKQAAAGK
jgi:hypothetical protein